jgi:hypothetical protein
MQKKILCTVAKFWALGNVFWTREFWSQVSCAVVPRYHIAAYGSHITNLNWSKHMRDIHKNLDDPMLSDRDIRETKYHHLKLLQLGFLFFFKHLSFFT